jgi:anti-anti-sigma factor
MDAPGPNFSALIARDQATTIVTCAGEFDLAVADTFREAIDAALAGKPQRLHLDCSRIEFIDSIGMRALMHTGTRCRDLAIHMTIEMSSVMRRVFDAVGVTCLFDLVPPSREDATDPEIVSA